MLEKIKFVWYWVMVFLFGKDGGRDGGVTKTVKEPSSVVVNEVVEKAKEAVDTLPVKKEEPVVETPVAVKESVSNRTGKKLLKDDDIRYIRKNAKVSKKELAAKFNVSEDTIRRIIKGDTYKDVK